MHQFGFLCSLLSLLSALHRQAAHIQHQPPTESTAGTVHASPPPWHPTSSARRLAGADAKEQDLVRDIAAPSQGSVTVSARPIGAEEAFGTHRAAAGGFGADSARDSAAAAITDVFDVCRFEHIRLRPKRRPACCPMTERGRMLHSQPMASRAEKPQECIV